MPIVNTDLVLYGSANRPTDDASLTGGAIDPDHRPEFTQLAATDTLEMVGSAGDTTQTVTVVGRDAAGALLSDTKTVNATSVVAFTGTFERVQDATLSADTTGPVTIRRSGGGPIVGVIPAGERGFYMHFRNSASDESPVTRYEKAFYYNGHGTLTLTNAEVTLTADPEDRIRVGLAPTVGDTATVANRLAAPGGVVFVDDNVAQAVPGGGNLPAGTGIGVWLEQALEANDPPFKTTATIRLAGQST